MTYFWIPTMHRFVLNDNSTSDSDSVTRQGLAISGVSNGMRIERILVSYTLHTQIEAPASGLQKPPESFMLGVGYVPNPDPREPDADSIPLIVGGKDQLFVDQARWRPLMYNDGSSQGIQWTADSGGMISTTMRRTIEDRTTAAVVLGGQTAGFFFTDDDSLSIPVQVSGQMYVKILINRVFS